MGKGGFAVGTGKEALRTHREWRKKAFALVRPCVGSILHKEEEVVSAGANRWEERGTEITITLPEGGGGGGGTGKDKRSHHRIVMEGWEKRKQSLQASKKALLFVLRGGGEPLHASDRLLSGGKGGGFFIDGFASVKIKREGEGAPGSLTHQS